jgi:hypothetical protein
MTGCCKLSGKAGESVHLSMDRRLCSAGVSVHFEGIDMLASSRFSQYFAAAATTAIVIGGVSIVGAQAGHANASATADNQLGSIVETYDYPNPGQAPAAVKLISGDGHILYVPCDTAPNGNIGLIHVHTTSTGLTEVCFQVHGTTGLLNVQVPAVFDIRGDGLAEGAGHNITATIDTASTDPTTVTVDPSGDTGVGIGDPHNGKEAALLQLKVTP